MENKERQKNYRQRMKEKGMVQRTVWVPECSLPALNAIASLRVVNEDISKPFSARSGDEIDTEFCEGVACEMWHHFRESLIDIGGEDMDKERRNRFRDETLAVLVALMPK